MAHVDTWLESAAASKDPGIRWAAWFFHFRRLPAYMQTAWKPYVEPLSLFCEYKGKYYRCTGASRFGDIWLQEDLSKEHGYTLRVDPIECSKWSQFRTDQSPGLFDDLPSDSYF